MPLHGNEPALHIDMGCAGLQRMLEMTLSPQVTTLTHQTHAFWTLFTISLASLETLGTQTISARKLNN